MSTIKGYTNIEQSRKLAKILPLESADMSWVSCDDGRQKYYQAENRKIILMYEKKHWIPCWSLASLLGFLPEFTLQRTNWENKTEYKIVVYINDDTYASKNYDNPIDAVYELILNLL